MAFPINQGDSFSSSTRQWDYDVFLSFSGEDTRNGFTGHLYHNLCEKGIKTFIDNDLQRGEEISGELLKAIRSSRISIIIFSQNYAFSAWCLDELVEILNCKQNGQLVLPVFYKVNPSEVRHQEGNFKVALTEQENKFRNNIEKVQSWRAALNKAASLSGWHYEDGEIVRQESPKILKKCSRLWHYEDALKVLTESKGSNKIRGIMWHSPDPITVQLHAKAFKEMENLKFLMVHNVLVSEELKYLPNGLKLLEWHEYPFSLPSNYCPQQLVVLEMPHSCIRLEKLFKQVGQCNNLKHLELESCISIRKLPDLCAPNLESLNINFCENLIEVHEAIGSLDKLKFCSLWNCKKLQILPSSIRLKSLEFINLYGCESLEKLPDLGAPNLRILDIRRCENLIEVHEAIGSLAKLENLQLEDCKKLQILPSTLRLKSLKAINLYGCVSLEKFPNFHPEMKCGWLSFSDGNIRDWPLSLKYLTSGLTHLLLKNCQNIGDFLVSILGCKFTNLSLLELCDCDGHILESHILMKPDSFPSLGILRIDGSNIVKIPGSIIGFTKLERLSMVNCKMLREIPRLPQQTRFVNAAHCTSLDLPSLCRLLNQLQETFMDPQFQETFMDPFMDPSLSNYQHHGLLLPRIEIPKGFKLNHQSVGKFVSFVVGREFQKLIVCLAFRSVVRLAEAKPMSATCFVVSDNGFSEKNCLDFYFTGGGCEHLFLCLVNLQGWNESKPSEQNHVTITGEFKYYGRDFDHTVSSLDDPKITWLGVHVE